LSDVSLYQVLFGMQSFDDSHLGNIQALTPTTLTMHGDCDAFLSNEIVFFRKSKFMIYTSTF